MTAFTHAKRHSMTPQQYARIFALRDGKCGCPPLGAKDWGCGRKLGPADKWRVEHSTALENGGRDDDDNKWLSCEWCWPKKDAADHAEAAEIRGEATRHTVPSEHRRSRAWGRR